MALFYNGSLIAGAFGNLIASGILKGLDGVRGISAWRWLYILEGVVTVATGILICLVLPDFPETWNGLDPKMAHVAKRRLLLDASEDDVDMRGSKAQFDGLKLALRDPKVWILTIAHHAFIGAGGFQNFYPTLTRTLGFTDEVSLLLVAPPYIFMAFYCAFHSWLSDKVQNRYWFFMCEYFQLVSWTRSPTNSPSLRPHPDCYCRLCHFYDDDLFWSALFFDVSAQLRIYNEWDDIRVDVILRSSAPS